MIYEKPQGYNIEDRIQPEEVVQVEEVQLEEEKPIEELPIEEVIEPKKIFKYTKLKLYDNIPVDKQFWKDVYYESISEEYFNTHEDQENLRLNSITAYGDKDFIRVTGIQTELSDEHTWEYISLSADLNRKYIMDLADVDITKIEI